MKRIFVAIDRTGKAAFAGLHPQATRMVAADLLRRVLEKPPDKIHTVLAENGVQLSQQPHQWFAGGHSFARVCRAFGVEHRLTNPAPACTNGQAERMNRALKEATGQRHHYRATGEFNEHLQAFLSAYARPGA